MSASFEVAAGGFSLSVHLDEAGVHMSRQTLGRTQSESIPWDRITGATLVRPAARDAAEMKNEKQMARWLGPEAVAKFDQLAGTVGQIFLAYRDAGNHLRRGEVPAPLGDPAYLQEFQTRLGQRWLGESLDRHQVDANLHTNPGFFKTAFILVALLGVVATVAAIGLLGLLGPILNFLSIQKMLLDLQDGNLQSFAYRLASYLALFILGYLLHRIIRSRLEQRQRFRPPRVAR